MRLFTQFGRKKVPVRLRIGRKITHSVFFYVNVISAFTVLLLLNELMAVN